MPEPDPPQIGEVARAALGTAAGRMLDTRQAALADHPDGVHQHRTAVRRLRSVLAAFAPLVDAPTATRLRVMYAEWGGQLGVVRDAEVRASVAEQALIDRDVDDAAIWRRLVDDERAQYSGLHARLVELASSQRLADADDALRAFVHEPDIADPGRRAKKRLRKVLSHEVRRVRRAGRRLDETADGWHDLRKAGRRLRYVAEAIDDAAPGLLGSAVVDLAEAGERVHDLLGDHRDLLIFAERLERERVRAAHAGEPVQVYDQLIADARKAADGRLAGLRAAVKSIDGAGASLR